MPLPSSPTPLVTVSPATHANLPNFDEAVVQTFSPYAFILVNNSDKAITGVYIRWSFDDPRDGHTIVHDLEQDSYKLPRFQVVLAAHDRLLVAPGALLPESLAYAPYVGQSIEQLDGRADSTLTANMPTPLSVRIEAIIFEDGAVYGPNEVAYDSEIQNRVLMGTALAKQIRDAMAQGADVNAMLTQMLATRVSITDSATRWRNMYARSLMDKSPDSPGWKARMYTLEHPQTLPVFVRK